MRDTENQDRQCRPDNASVTRLNRRRDWVRDHAYIGYGAQVGDDLIAEWGAGRQFNTQIGPVSVGLVGYAYWQVTNTTGAAIPTGEVTRRGSVYALGPEINATTKFGRYFLRFYSEFGGANTPQGNIVMLGVTL